MHTTGAPGAQYDVLHIVVTWEIHIKQRQNSKAWKFSIWQRTDSFWIDLILINQKCRFNSWLAQVLLLTKLKHIYDENCARLGYWAASTTTCCIKTWKSAVLIYFAVEAWNHAHLWWFTADILNISIDPKPYIALALWPEEHQNLIGIPLKTLSSFDDLGFNNPYWGCNPVFENPWFEAKSHQINWTGWKWYDVQWLKE